MACEVGSASAPASPPRAARRASDPPRVASASSSRARVSSSHLSIVSRVDLALPVSTGSSENVSQRTRSPRHTPGCGFGSGSVSLSRALAPRARARRRGDPATMSARDQPPLGPRRVVHRHERATRAVTRVQRDERRDAISGDARDARAGRRARANRPRARLHRGVQLEPREGPGAHCIVDAHFAHRGSRRCVARVSRHEVDVPSSERRLIPRAHRRRIPATPRTRAGRERA